MGVVKQQSVKGSLVTYIGVIIGAFNVFFVFPYFLNPETIGLLKSIEAIGLLVVPFVYLGIPYAINKYYPILKEKHPEKFKFFISKSLLFLFFNTMALSFLFFLFKTQISHFFIDKSPLLSKWILISIPVFVGISWTITLAAIAASNLRIAFPKLLERVVLRLMHVILVILFSLAFLSESNLILIFGFIYLIPAIVALIYVVKRSYLPVNIFNLPKNVSFDFSEIKSYTFFMSLSTLGTSIISHIGMIMVSSFLGLELAGIFFIAFYMGFILDVPANNFSAILRPVLAESLEFGNIQNVSNLYKKSSLVQFMFSGFLFLLLFFNINDVFVLMPNGSTFVEGKWVVLIVGAGYVLKNLAGCYFDIIIMSKYYRFSVLVTVLVCVFTIFGYIYCINVYGLLGAAFATAGATVINAILFVIFIYFFYKINPFSLNTLSLFLVFVFVAFIAYFLPDCKNIFISIFYKSMTLTLIFLFLIYLFKISSDVNQLIDDVLKHLKIIKLK